MFEKAHFYVEGVLNFEKPLLCVDPKGMCAENDIILALKILEQALFQCIVGKGLENSLQSDQENTKFYDEMWLFGHDDWWIRLLCMISLKYQEDEFSKWKCRVAPCRHNLLFRKGSFFSQPVNGFV